MDHKTRADALRRMPVSGVRYCRNDISGHALAFDHVVSHGLVGHQPEDRGQRVGTATDSWNEELQNGVGFVAQTEARHGATRTRPIVRSG